MPRPAKITREIAKTKRWKNRDTHTTKAALNDASCAHSIDAMIPQVALTKRCWLLEVTETRGLVGLERGGAWERAAGKPYWGRTKPMVRRLPSPLPISRRW